MNHSEREYGIIRGLLELVRREDRATLAKLRRGLGREPGSDADMYSFVGRYLPEESDWWYERHLFLIASLFAFHPEHRSIGSMGETMKRIGQESNVEKRVAALLHAHWEDLPGLLRQAIGLARTKGAPVDYNTLLYHLLHWNDASRWVQRQWARDFWRGSEKTDESEIQGQTVIAEENIPS